MTVTASALRQNIYQMLDSVIETGVPIEIHRKGCILKIVSFKESGKLQNLKKRDRDSVMVGDPEDFVHVDWSSEWKQ